MTLSQLDIINKNFQNLITKVGNDGTNEALFLAGEGYSTDSGILLVKRPITPTGLDEFYIHIDNGGDQVSLVEFSVFST
jgi:hypothetical protein